MPVQELENLRQKYPQYNGIDDMTLATKLAGKYPQYGFILDKVKSEDGAFNSFPKNRRDNLNKGISGQDIVQHPFQSIGKTLMQPAEESLTGRSIADKTDASIQKEAKNFNPKGMNPYEVKNKLGDIQDAAFKKMVMAEFADQLTTPINYVGGKAVGEAAKGLVKGVQGIGKLAGYESGRIINSLIKPSEKAFNFGKNPGLQVVKEKITANTMEELGSKIKQSLEDASNKLKEKIGLANKTGKTADYSDMLNPINQAIKDAKRLPKTNAELIIRLENAKHDLLLNKDLTKLKPEEAVQLKRDIGDVTKWTKEGTDDATANKALKQAYHSVKTTLEKEIPGIKEDNERLANLIGADTAIVKRTKIEQKSGFADGLFQKGALFDTAVGVARGDVHEVIRGISEYGITKIMGSPFAKTRVAQWLNNLSKSDLVEAVNKMPQLKSLIRVAKNQFNKGADKAQSVDAELVDNRPKGIGVDKSIKRSDRLLPSDAKRGTGPVIKQGGEGQGKIGQEKKLGLPRPTQVKGEGFTMNNPSKGQVISDAEAGRNPMDEDNSGVILHKTDIQRAKEMAQIDQETKQAIKKSANGFLKDIKGKIKSEYGHKVHFMYEEFSELKNSSPEMFSPKGMEPGIFASEIARKYPEMFNYKDPEKVLPEDLVQAYFMAKKLKGGK